ncbi:helix-turn-helix domain-containing protein [Sesbania bispinosa]|nr:helix-turn-helix domain-containing protein [Sesbania bispinosa]
MKKKPLRKKRRWKKRSDGLKRTFFIDEPDAQVAKVLSKLKDVSDLASPRQEEPQPTIKVVPEEPGAPTSTSAHKE